MNKKLLNFFGFVFNYTGLNKIRKCKLTILLYHRIIDNEDNFDSSTINATIKDFDKQIKYLSKNYNIISLKRFLYGKLPKNAAIITFDDGYKDIYINAFPILKRYKANAIIFLTTNFIDGEIPWWDKVAYIINNCKLKKINLSELGGYNLNDKYKVITNIKDRLYILDEYKRNRLIKDMEKRLEIKVPKNIKLFMSWSNIKEMKEYGIEFGVHTMSHPLLTKISLSEIKKEIVNSKKIIENKINNKIVSFAYPYGTVNDFNENIYKLLKDNDILCAFTNIQGTNKKINLYKLKRICISRNDSFNVFKLKLCLK